MRKPLRPSRTMRISQLSIADLSAVIDVYAKWISDLNKQQRTQETSDKIRELAGKQWSVKRERERRIDLIEFTTQD